MRHDHSHHAANDGAHDRHAGHSVAMFRDRFWIALALTVPTMLWSEMIQHWFGYRAPAFPGSSYLPAVLGTAVYFYGGWPFLQGAARELRNRLPGMMTLIALAISVAFGFSLAVTLGVPGIDLWWELATLVTIMLLGHWIEMQSISQAQGALKALAKLLPDKAVRLRADGDSENVPVTALVAGDLLLIRPGAGIPADGIVSEGRSTVNESMITGESRPVVKQAGDAVIAGTLNGQGSLRVRVTRVGEGTALAGIMRLVAQAQQSRSRAQALADRAARLLTYTAIAAATITTLIWAMLGAPWNYTIERVVTVLVIACPHALGLAVPLVVAISTMLGVRHGLLVRDRRGLEEARRLDIVVFDKTGTLTLGEHRVVDIATVDGFAADAALALAAAAERDAEHPIARALHLSAADRKLDLPVAREFQAMPGRGVSAAIDGRTVEVGGPALLRAKRLDVPGALRSAEARAAEAGRTVVYLIDDGEVGALFAIADAVRPESREAIRRLHAAGIEVAMLTGDARAVADSVARELRIDTVLAEVLPEDKAAVIEKLQAQGKRVAMVGDGVNDAPALVTADVGIAIGAGTDVAVEAGDIVLVRSDPRDVPAIIALSRATYRKMIQNLWWAAGYNLLAIPLAAGALAAWGVLLAPAVGAVLMSVSTVVVALNAQLLRRTPMESI
ncbi:MAG: heavy metal translocating P-type ATPase [Rehaibacterium terrae]|uniref:heavy metal translocating P-type ATPase n=1 Tax=Rehaibacterium terrae TaxID=1341696 RepID=UPI00391C9042